MTELQTADPWTGRSWPTWTEPLVVDVDGVPTAYRRKGSGPTVVYLHPVGISRGWFPFPEALSAGADVVAPEHPGFGDTPRTPTFTTWQDWVLHYEAFFRALDLRDIHLVGDSFGAWLAAELAVTYPTLFASVTLITPLGLRLRDVRSVDLFRLDEAEVDDLYYNGRQQAVAVLLDQGDELDRDIHAIEEAASFAVLAWNPRYDTKLDSRLGRVIRPALVVGVDDDRIASNRMAERYAELIPGSRLEIVHGPVGEPSGHRVALEQPEPLAQLVSRHIVDNSPRRKP